MLLEAPVLAAMVTASASLLSKAIEWVGHRSPKEANDAKEIVDEAYSPLKGRLTGGCVRVLKMLEGGEYRMISQIRA